MTDETNVSDWLIEDFNNSLKDFSDSQIQKLIRDATRSNEPIAAENEMFEQYLTRVEPPQDLVHGRESIAAGAVLKKAEHATAFRQKKAKSASVAVSKVMLNIDQKCDIAYREVNELAGYIQRKKVESERIIENYTALSQEADICLKEIKKETFQFERDIVKGAISGLTNTVKAEKCVRYFEDRLKLREAYKEKMLLKINSMKVQERKLMYQLKQKEKIGDLLDEVDFNQLKIINQQYIQTLSERCQDLLRMKITAGSTMQVLNMYKRRNQKLTKESEQLDTEITVRNESKRKVEAEIQVIEMERAHAEFINSSLRKNVTKFEYPTIMDYVMENSETVGFQQRLKNLERKVRMAESKYIANKRTWRKMEHALEYRYKGRGKSTSSVSGNHGVAGGLDRQSHIRLGQLHN